MNSDLLDIYCKRMFGHKDWEINFVDGNAIVTFFRNAREDYVEEDEEVEDYDEE